MVLPYLAEILADRIALSTRDGKSARRPLESARGVPADITGQRFIFLRSQRGHRGGSLVASDPNR
jgi:hypothetical protein